MSRFRVKISGVSVAGLETRLHKHMTDVKERICPYIKFNFDNFKAYKTEMTTYKGSPPSSVFSNFSAEFYYETRFPDMLPAKFLLIECCDAAAGSKDSVIGSAVVDLFTIATGAENYTIPLFAEDIESLKTRAKLIANKLKAKNLHSFPTMDVYVGIDPGDVNKFESKVFNEKGRIQFKIEMEQFADPVIIMKPLSVNISTALGASEKTQLELWFNGLKKTIKLKGTFKAIQKAEGSVAFEGATRDTTLTYEVGEMAVPCSFKTLLNNAICFSFTKFGDKSAKDMQLTGEAKLSTIILHKLGKEEFSFEVPLMAGGGKTEAKQHGTIKGTFFVKDPPRFMQLSGGISSELGTNGKILLSGLEVPVNYSENDIHEQMMFKETPSRPRARTLSSQLEQYSNNPLFDHKASSQPLMSVTEELTPELRAHSTDSLRRSGNAPLQQMFERTPSDILTRSDSVPNYTTPLNRSLKSSGNNPIPSNRSLNSSSNSAVPLGKSGDLPSLSSSTNYPSLTSSQYSSSSDTPALTPTSAPHTPTTQTSGGVLRSSGTKADASGHKPLPSQVHLISRPMRSNSSPNKRTPKTTSQPNSARDAAYPNYSPMQHQYGSLQTEDDD